MLIDNILKKLNIEALNEMQTATVEAIAKGNDDVVVLSPTGSGKTLAYLLPMTDKINCADDTIQMIVVVPGRELALQSANVANSMGCGVRAMAVYGGRPAMDEHRKMRQVKPHVIFGTPGRLNDHLLKQNILVESVRWLVIDEFDKCLAMGFHEEMRKLTETLHQVRQRVLLSATDAESIPHFVNMRKTVRLNFLRDEELVPERVKIYTVKSPEKDKLETLYALLCELGDRSSIVFLNYRDSVERTDMFLRRRGFVTSAFHGGLDQRQREDAIFKFSNGSAHVLVATDLASRGLDIPDIDNIIHYHLPLGQDEYVHRVGRTARWQARGNAFFILAPEETVPDYIDADIQLHDIPQQLPPPPHPRMATVYIGKGKNDKISKGDIVGFLCKKGNLQKDEIGRVDVKERYAYAAVAFDKLSQVIRMTKGEKIKGIKTVVEPVR
jgi:superfamily II DNA/RNA helicase